MTTLMKETVTDAGEEGKSHARCTHTSHAPREWILPSRRASFVAAVMSIRMEIKIFATQIGFTLMKVISLGKKRSLIQKMSIDSATHSLLSPYLGAEDPPAHTHTKTHTHLPTSTISTVFPGTHKQRLASKQTILSETRKAPKNSIWHHVRSSATLQIAKCVPA